jgi:hypothetical protein
MMARRIKKATKPVGTKVVGDTVPTIEVIRTLYRC